MKKRILFFIATLNDGGAQRVVSIISSKIVEKGFDVEILKYYDSDNIYPLNKEVKINSVVGKTKTKNVFVNMCYVHKYFKNNADCVVSFLAPFNIFALLANIGNHIPIIVADRNDPRKVPNSIIARLIRNAIYKIADGIVVQNKENAIYFKNKKCYIIENPFDDNNYIGKALTTNKVNKIVSVGRLCEQKNHLMLIDAFSIIKKEFTNYKLEIFGDFESYKFVLDNEVNRLKLNGSIDFKGSRKNVLDEISSAKIFVLSSNYEGMPNALIEAMCLGLPCISTKIPGTIDLIDNNINGILVDINDVDALANSIKTLLNDDDMAIKLAKNACMISSKFDTDVIVDKWIQLIENV